MARRFGSLAVGSKICKAGGRPTGERLVRPKGALGAGYRNRDFRTDVSERDTEKPVRYRAVLPSHVDTVVEGKFRRERDDEDERRSLDV